MERLNAAATMNGCVECEEGGVCVECEEGGSVCGV